MTRCPEGQLLIDEPASGAWNMAVDEALLETAAEGRATLRFYQWSEPTLSLGYFQAYQERRNHPASQSATVVRRQTGGGALLHDRELTYSLCLPASTRWARDHEQLYEQVHRGVATVLAERSVETRLYRELAVEGGLPEASPFLCFLRRTGVDIVAPTVETPAGQKILGSAQRRRRGALLQHGGLLLKRSSAAPELPGVAEVCGVELDPASLIEQLAAVLPEELGLCFAPGVLLKPQRQRAEQLQTKYQASAWTGRR